MMACPAGTNAGRYVSLIAEGRFEEAYRYARDPNPMASVCGRVCAHPCETACRRGAIDSPISIRALKRFLTETLRAGVAASAEDRPFHGRPAALPCRDCWQRTGGTFRGTRSGALGYSVTIFEAASVAGGMLSLGIPEYRLPRSVVEAQIREILDAGDVTLEAESRRGTRFHHSPIARTRFRRRRAGGRGPPQPRASRFRA